MSKKFTYIWLYSEQDVTYLSLLPVIPPPHLVLSTYDLLMLLSQSANPSDQFILPLAGLLLPFSKRFLPVSRGKRVAVNNNREKVPEGFVSMAA